MKEKKVIKLKMYTIILIVYAVLIIFLGILFITYLNKPELFILNSKIKDYATRYTKKEQQLKVLYDELYDKSLGDLGLTVLKESAKTLEDAEKLFEEYKQNLNINLGNKNIEETERFYTDFEYIDFIETDYYYKYVGEYSYYNENDVTKKEYPESQAVLIFKSDYFDYPYLKKHDDVYSIEKFGDILTILNFKRNEEIVKSTVKENLKNFTYNLYYISRSSSGPHAKDMFDMVPDVITAYHYNLKKATLIVDKKTGKINLELNKERFNGNNNYLNSYYPCMNIEYIKGKGFTEEF